MTRTPARALTPALALALAALAACSEADSTPFPGSTVVDSAGVQIVTNTTDGTWTDGAGWTFDEVFRVGGFEAGENERFGSVISVDVDPDGRVYVADQQAKHVRVFADDGAYIQTLGAPGQGPGEIGPMLMGMFERSGEVWTIDPAGQGIQRFSLDEGYVGSTPFNIMGGIPIRLDEIDESVIAQRRGAGGVESMGQSGDAVATIGTESADTLMVLPAGQMVVIEGGAPSIALFAPEPRWDVADNGAAALGMDNIYRIEVSDADGALERIVVRDVEPSPITEGMQSALRRAMREQMEAFGAPPAVVEPTLQQMTFAETVPLFGQFILESDGHLWVQRILGMDEVTDREDFDLQDLGSNRWDIFDPAGRYLGEVEVPGRFQPYRLIDGVLWGFDRDEFDVQSVVGMRVVR